MITMYFGDQGLRSQAQQGLLTPPPDRGRTLSYSPLSEAPSIETEEDLLESAVSHGDLESVRRIFDAERQYGHPVQRLGSRRLSDLLLRTLDQKEGRISDYLINQDVPFSSSHVELAVTRGLNSFLGAFLQRGWNVNEPDSQGSPLLVKVLDNIGLMAWFLQHGADPNAKCHRGTTPLSMAVAHHSLEHVRIMLSHGGCVNKGQLLHFAVCRRDTEGMEIAQLLLASGARVNSLMCEDDPAAFQAHRQEGLGAPLHYAASSGMLETVRLLLHYGADPTLPNTLGLSSIQVATDARQPAAVELMKSSSVARAHSLPKKQYNTIPSRRQISIGEICN